MGRANGSARWSRDCFVDAAGLVALALVALPSLVLYPAFRRGPGLSALPEKAKPLSLGASVLTGALAALAAFLRRMRRAGRRGGAAEVSSAPPLPVGPPDPDPDPAAQLAMLQALFEDSDQAIAVFDEGGRLTDWNRRFPELLRISTPLLRGRTSLADIGRQGTSPAWVVAWAALGPGVATTLVIEHAGLWLDLRSRPISGGRLVTTLADITAYREVEARAQRSGRLEIIGQLTGGLAHDFNNLLTVIQGNLDLLAIALAKDARLSGMIDAAQRSAERGARLTRQLVAFAQRQVLRPATVDIEAAMGRVAPLLQRSVDGLPVEIAVAVAPDVDRCRVDPAQLETALLNLVLNARDALPRGGRITVSARNLEIDAVAARRLDAVEGSYVEIAVGDTGIGMPPEILDHALEPFFTTKEPGRGSGLGLSQVEGFVRQSGGHVKIASSPGRGTTVAILLPRADLAAAASALAPPACPSGAAERGGRTARVATVLVVEDEAEVRELVVETLQAIGYRVLSAADGHQAIALLGRDEPIDLIFSDVVMPSGVSGVDVARQARRLRRDIKVLLTSGYSEQVIAGHGANDGFEVVPKPYRQDEVAAKVRAVLGR